MLGDKMLAKKADELTEQELIELFRKELSNKKIFSASEEYDLTKRIAKIENIPEEEAREYLLDIEAIVCALTAKKL